MLSRDKTMANKLMYIPNEDTQDCPFLYITISCWIVWTQFNKSWRYYKTLGTSVIKSPLSHLFLVISYPFPSFSMEQNSENTIWRFILENWQFEFGRKYFIGGLGYASNLQSSHHVTFTEIEITKLVILKNSK